MLIMELFSFIYLYVTLTKPLHSPFDTNPIWGTLYWDKVQLPFSAEEEISSMHWIGVTISAEKLQCFSVFSALPVKVSTGC